MIRCKTIHTSWGTSKQIEGQMSISDYMARLQPHEVDIRGLCDDAYCPECGVCLDDFEYKDCEKCPYCGLRIDWTPWHRLNDKETEE